VYVAVDWGGSKNTSADAQPYALAHLPWLPPEARHTVEFIGCARPVQPVALTVAVALVPVAGSWTSRGADTPNEQFTSSARAFPLDPDKPISTPRTAMRTADALRIIAE
jgi:hypothetical protein